MAITTELYISGVIADECYDISVTKSYSDNNSASSFSATIDNLYGKNKSDFGLGNEIKVYSDSVDIQPGSSPYAYWKLNEGSGSLLNDSTGNLTGSIFGTNATWDIGKLGSSLRMVGSDVVGAEIQNTGSSTVTGFPFSSGPFTAMFWVKLGSLYPNQYIFDHYDWRFYTSSSSGLTLSIGRMNSGSGAAHDIFIGSPLALNTWYHVAGVYNPQFITANGYIEGYLNGRLITNKNIGSDVIYLGYNSGRNLKIGNSDHGNASGLNGWIDDIRIYDSVLSAENISAITNYGQGTEIINNGSQLLFTGILEDVEYAGENMSDKIQLSGRDYTARLIDRTVEPEVYNNYEVGSIVRDIMSKYVNDVSYSGVQTTPVTLPRIVFNHKPVYDAIRDLAEQSNYIFYVDINKDLKFQSAGSVSSGFTFDSGNTIKASFTTQRDTIFNQVWVYGDRYLDGFKQTFTAGSPLGGSVFTLLYNPNNTEVTVSGATIQPGAIDEIASTPASGTRYLVNYHDKTVTFTSGTSLGANIPQSGNAVVINYKRALPIVKVGDDESSKSQYGTRVKVIVDKDIKDPTMAENIMKKELENSANPESEGNMKVIGYYNLTPSDTCVVNFPNENINNRTYDILQANYQFNKDNNLTEQVLEIKVNKKINDVTDTIKGMLLDIKKMQGGDISDADIITRFQTSTGSLSVRQSGAIVYISTITGSGYHLYATNFTPPSGPWHLASGTLQAGLAGSFTGSAAIFGPFTVIFSGAYLT